MRANPPSLSVLCNAVRVAESRWQSQRDESRWGAVKKASTNLSRSADDYSQLLAVIPANDKYISLLNGSLSAIVKASVQHEDIAFAIHEILDQLCDDMRQLKKQIMAHPNVESMRGDVWELYVVCFELLTEVFTEWSSSWGKRFWKSFDKNAANKLFASKKAAIASLTIKLDRAAKVDTERVVQQYLPNVVTKEHLEEALLQHLHNVVIQEHLSEAILILGTRLFIQAVGGGARCEQGLAERNETAEPATMVSTSSHVDDNSELTKPIIRKQGFGCSDIMASNQKIAMFLYHPLDELKRLQDRASHLDIDRRIVSRLH